MLNGQVLKLDDNEIPILLPEYKKDINNIINKDIKACSLKIPDRKINWVVRISNEKQIEQLQYFKESDVYTSVKMAKRYNPSKTEQRVNYNKNKKSINWNTYKYSKCHR